MVVKPIAEKNICWKLSTPIFFFVSTKLELVLVYFFKKLCDIFLINFVYTVAWIVNSIIWHYISRQNPEGEDKASLHKHLTYPTTSCNAIKIPRRSGKNPGHKSSALPFWQDLVVPNHTAVRENEQTIGFHPCAANVLRFPSMFMFPRVNTLPRPFPGWWEKHLPGRLGIFRYWRTIILPTSCVEFCSVLPAAGHGARRTNYHRLIII